LRLCDVASFDFAPGVDAAENKAGEQEQNYEDSGDRKPSRWRRNALFRFGCGDCTLATRQVIFGEQAFFAEAQVASDGANEAAAEDAAWQFRPIFIFQGVEKTRADAGRLRDFIERDLAQFPFALEAFAKRTFRHAVKTVLAQSAPHRPKRRDGSAGCNETSKKFTATPNRTDTTIPDFRTEGGMTAWHPCEGL